ncbi:MAG: hypothetical protein ACYCWW_09120 [Deltaproteobacteria bacterium]
MAESGNKKSGAVAFIQDLGSMEPQRLSALIAREAGEELAQFFLSYSSGLISRDPERVLENTSSLMLMGYLIRAAEERRRKLVVENQAQA